MTTEAAPRVQNYIMLKKVRIAFAEGAYRAKHFNGDPTTALRYSVSLVIEKGSDNDKLIRSVIKEKATEKWKDKAQAMLQSLGKDLCYTDGDLAKQECFHGKMRLGANRGKDQGRPILLDKNKLPAAEGRIYSGCFVNAKVDIWVQVKGMTGVRCTLIGLQFTEDGDAFGGGGPATDSGFETEEETTSETENSGW